MSWWQAVILGIVQGLTEFLPVSSSGHLIMTAWVLGLRDDASAQAAMNTYDLVLHMGTVLAVAGLYRQRVGQMSRGVLGGDVAGRRLAGQLLLAFLPVGLVGYLGSDVIRDSLYGPWPIVAALVVGGAIMLAVSYNRRLRQLRVTGLTLEQVNWQIALAIGLVQCAALWPGMSRSMVTLVAALVLGLRAKAAAEFSFLLGMITIAVITVYELSSGGARMFQQLDVLPIMAGFAAAAISAALAVKWFVGFLTQYGLAPFGWYRIVTGVLLAAMLVLGVVEAGVAW